MDVALLLVLADQMGTCASQSRHHDAKQAHLGILAAACRSGPAAWGQAASAQTAGPDQLSTSKSGDRLRSGRSVSQIGLTTWLRTQLLCT